MDLQQQEQRKKEAQAIAQSLRDIAARIENEPDTMLQYELDIDPNYGTREVTIKVFTGHVRPL
jgi:hypothetical protein